MVADGLQSVPRGISHFPPSRLHVDLDLAHKAADGGGGNPHERVRLALQIDRVVQALVKPALDLLLQLVASSVAVVCRVEHENQVLQGWPAWGSGAGGSVADVVKENLLGVLVQIFRKDLGQIGETATGR